MMNALFTALTSLFTMFTTLCNAGNKGAKSLDNLGRWSEAATDTFANEAEHDRTVALEESAFKREQRKKELDALRLAATVQQAAQVTKAKAPATPAP